MYMYANDPLLVIFSIHLKFISLSVGIDLTFNVTCEEAELTDDDYLKILWTAAAELPGVYMYKSCILCLKALYC